MALVTGPPYTGSPTVDLSDVKDVLVDLPEGAMRGIRGEQPGMDKVMAELAKSIPAYGDAAGIPPQVYPRILKRSDKISKLRAHQLELSKLTEVCNESLAKEENDQEDDISIVAHNAQDTARRMKDPGITAPFEETIRYNGQIAEKGQQTKKHNEAAKKAAASTPTTPATPAKGTGTTGGSGGTP